MSPERENTNSSVKEGEEAETEGEEEADEEDVLVFVRVWVCENTLVETEKAIPNVKRKVKSETLNFKVSHPQVPECTETLREKPAESKDANLSVKEPYSSALYVFSFLPS